MRVTFDFYQQTESPPHNNVHISVGSDMGTMYSPNDSIFWLHHAFVDKQWNDWQQLNPRNARVYGGTNSDGSPALSDDRLHPYNHRVADVFDTRNLCYIYASFRVSSRFSVNQSPSMPTTTTAPSSPVSNTSSILTMSNKTLLDPLEHTEIFGICVPVLSMRNFHVWTMPMLPLYVRRRHSYAI